MWTMTLWHQGSPLVQWGAVIGASLVAAGCDLRSRRIPNRLTGPVLLAGLVWSIYVGGLAGLCDSLAACLLLATPYVVLFLFAGGGAGDAKLMAAVGAWLGIISGIVALVAVSLAAIVLAIAFAARRKALGSALTNIVGFSYALLFALSGRGRMKDRTHYLPKTKTMQTMPYGVAILTGVCIAAGAVALWCG